MAAQILSDYSQLLSSPGRVVCIGNFDGLHLGHQQILRKSLEEATRLQLESLCLTFHPHPKNFFGRQPVAELMSRNEKISLLRKSKFDCVLIQEFNESFAKLSADEFIFLLHKKFSAELVVVGRDFHFGHGARGSVSSLKQSQLFETLEVEDFKAENSESSVSSGRIRQALALGSLAEVYALLGFPFFVEGEVQPGEGRGHTLGFPTLNLLPEKTGMPPEGVYLTAVEVLGSQVLYLAVSNWGHAPSFGPRQKILESHLMGYTGDVSKTRLRVFILERLRPELKFPSVNDLVLQIEKDIKEAMTRALTLKDLRASLSSMQKGSGGTGVLLKDYKPLECFENWLILPSS